MVPVIFNYIDNVDPKNVLQMQLRESISIVYYKTVENLDDSINSSANVSGGIVNSEPKKPLKNSFPTEYLPLLETVSHISTVLFNHLYRFLVKMGGLWG